MKIQKPTQAGKGVFAFRKSTLLFASLLCAVGGFLTGCGDKKEDGEAKGGEKGQEKLVIAAIPDEKVSDQEAKFQAVSDYLAKELGIPVEFSITSNYAAAVQRFTNGEVHLVWFGGLSGVQARSKVPGARAIAQGEADPNFKTYFIANAETGLEYSEDFPTAIKDMTFTFGDPGSTSSRLMPTYFIKENTGKDPEEFFSKPVQFQSKGGHHAVAKAVESGSVQVGVLNFKTYDSMVASGDLDPEKAVKIWVTPDYADYNLTVHPALEEMFGEGFIDRLQTVLVECKDPGVLKAFNREKLIPARNEDFQGIVDVAKELDMLR